jgi:hypothetical protein
LSDLLPDFFPAVALVLLLAELLEHPDLATGVDQGLPAPLDLGLQRLALASETLLLGPKHQFVAPRFQQSIQVELARGGTGASPCFQIAQLACETSSPVPEDFVRPVRLREFRAPLVAGRLAEAQQRGQSEPELRHGLLPMDGTTESKGASWMIDDRRLKIED